MSKGSTSIMWSGVRVRVDPTVAAASSMLLLITFSLFAVAGLARLARRLRRAQRGGSDG